MTSDVSEASTSNRPAQEPSPPARPSSATWRRYLVWEAGLVVVLIATVVFGAVKSDTFLTTQTFFYLGIDIGYVAIMALPMTLIVMTGEIDLSVASMLGLSGATVGLLWHHGWPIWAALLAALVVGAIGGALNGLLVARIGLPSIAVTIGTLALFRGIAEILIAPDTIPGAGDRLFPTSLTDIGVLPIGGTEISWSLGIFAVLAVITAVVLHATPLGRSLYAIGLQPEAAVFAGIRVNLIKFALFVVSGVLCAFAGIILSLQNGSVSYDAGTGLELNVVAIVLFGGVSIFGGRGTVGGVVLAVAIFGSLQLALTQINVNPQVQNIITGVLLLASVVIPNGGDAVTRLRARLRRITPTSPPPVSSRKEPA